VSAPGDRLRIPGEPGSDPAATPPVSERLTDGEAARAEADVATALLPGSDEGPSPRHATCAYLRTVDPDGTLRRPYDLVTSGQACIAMGEPAPLSDRQQGLVCLSEAHADCPRYRRATLAVPVSEPVVARSRRPRPATLAALTVLVLSTFVAAAFVAVNGGLGLPIASTGPSPATSDLAAASATPLPGSSSSPTATSSPGSSSLTSPTPGSDPSPSLEPSAGPTATPTATATPSPSSDRYELLKACPGRVDCYIYTVRRGDNLFSIARYFGVPLDTVYRLNPWLRGTGLRAGQELILPPPTR
jgi:hypothetical protein